MIQVGVLIGKAGETIKFLQFNTGAKIQITRDAEADPHAPTRPVELIGTIESINKAEKLIKDVIAEVRLFLMLSFLYLVDDFFLFHLLMFLLQLIFFLPYICLISFPYFC